MKYIVIFTFSIILSQHIAAKEAIIENGFKAFKEGGANLAWPAFTKGGPMEGSKEVLAQASQFGKISAFYGNYVSHEYILEKVIGKNNKIIYITLNLDSGALFGMVHVYKTANNSWIISNLNFNPYVDQIWPFALYSDLGK